MVRPCSIPALVLGFTLLAGCGGGGGSVDLYNVAGTITYNGEPVPYGRIEFEPDTAGGNVGGPGYAEIKAGEYDTSAAGGRGVIGGRHFVFVTGLESEPTDDGHDEVAAAEQEPVKQLFVRYQVTEHDFPKEDGQSYDLEVPAEAASSVNPDNQSSARRSGPPEP